METKWKDVCHLYSNSEVRVQMPKTNMFNIYGEHEAIFQGIDSCIAPVPQVRIIAYYPSYDIDLCKRSESIWIPADEIKPILRPLSDMTNKEINQICSIAMGRDIECFEINWTEERDFVSAYWKREYNDSSSEKWQYVSYGIWISDNLNVKFKWVYRYHNGDGVDDQNLPNHNHVTAYLLKQGFDLFSLIPNGYAIDRTTLPSLTNNKI